MDYAVALWRMSKNPARTRGSSFNVSYSEFSSQSLWFKTGFQTRKVDRLNNKNCPKRPPLINGLLVNLGLRERWVSFISGRSSGRTLIYVSGRRGLERRSRRRRVRLNGRTSESAQHSGRIGAKELLSGVQRGRHRCVGTSSLRVRRSFIEDGPEDIPQGG